MKAYVLHGVRDLRYEEIAYPECNSGWVVVKVQAAGICSSDIPRILKKGTYHFPTVPGHEFSGIVDRVADEKDKHWLGKKVGIYPLIPCRKCSQCAQGRYEMCMHYDYIGSRRDGGFAEYVQVPVWNLIELPEHMDCVEAAMLEPLSVALHAMKIAQVRQGDSVTIIGTGMIGIAAAQWAKAMGAGSVAVLGRGEEKRAMIEEIDGLTYINSKSIDTFQESDVVLEAVGSSSAIDAAINCAGAGGNVVLMGNPEGDIQLSQNTYWRILRKQLRVMGTWNSSYECQKSCDWTEAVRAIADGTVQVRNLITHYFDQEKLKAGLELMEEKKEPYCKVMTLWNRK